MTPAELLKWTLLAAAALAFAGIVISYAKGLRRSPRDMWLLFGYKFLEYSAYGAINPALMLWLGKDVGLGDIKAGSVIAAWSIALSVVGMAAGALVDSIGIRKTMIVSVFFLLFSRIALAFITHPVLAYVFALLPFAVGLAIIGPLVSVAIKRYTTKEGAAMGFGFFYVVMNVAFAVGAYLFDKAREVFAARDAVGNVINENAGVILLGHHFSTYQIIFLWGLVAAAGSLVLAMFVRDGVEMDESGTVVIHPKPPRKHWLAVIKDAFTDTGSLIARTSSERFFWIYMTLLGTTLFVRFVFYHFHYTFPSYGTRVLGEGAKIGSIFGVLNPVLIIFLVPLVAWLTRKTSSYQVMIWGSIVSSLACFIAAMPGKWFAGLTDTVWGDLIFIQWLGMAENRAALLAAPPHEAYWPLIVCILIFTIGEAIWSPRLMQFTAEIAPKGKEGTYIALSVLPYFMAKFFVGPLSGWLLHTYTPLDANDKPFAAYPDHTMIWVWIGGMAVISPIGLVLFRKWFLKHAPVSAEPSVM
ncbi:MAG: MFS transporter [Verrucomicrobiota bacterium]